jgi:hypothetical protein
VAGPPIERKIRRMRPVSDGVNAARITPVPPWSTHGPLQVIDITVVLNPDFVLTPGLWRFEASLSHKSRQGFAFYNPH